MVICQIDSIPKNVGGKYEYSGVIQVDSANATKLYSNAKLFIIDEFKSGKDVTQLNDDNTKTVAGSGTDKIVLKGYVGSAIDKYLKFKILIQCKDNKYKYTINNFEISFYSSMVNQTLDLESESKFKNHYLTKKQVIELYQKVNSDMKSIIEDLKKHMASQTDNTKDF